MDENFGPIEYAHYSDVITGAMAFQITSLAIVYSTVYSGGDQTKHQGSASPPLSFSGNSPLTGNSPHEGPVTRKCCHLMTSSWINQCNPHPNYQTHRQSQHYRRQSQSQIEILGVITDSQIQRSPSTGILRSCGGYRKFGGIFLKASIAHVLLWVMAACHGHQGDDGDHHTTDSNADIWNTRK